MIHFASPFAQYQKHKKEILEAVREVLEQGEYILGKQVFAFERAFAAYCGVENAVGVNSGTDALILSLRGLDIGRGDEVITVSHTALATVAAVIAVGATPVLVDVDATYYTLDPEGLRRAITSKTKAVIPVHLYGQAADMSAIMGIAAEHGLSVIEDCAQAVGATDRGVRVGGIGDVGCFSFYPTKNLGAIGDAGMVVTRNAELGARIRRLRQYGWDENRTTTEPGLNSRLDEIQAAILQVKLRSLDSANARRRAIAAKYAETLGELPIVLPAERPESSHVYHLYVINCENRDWLKAKVADRGISAGVHYPVPAHRHPGYDRRHILPAGGLPVTEALVERILSLPIYPEMASSEIGYVASVLLSTYSDGL